MIRRLLAFCVCGLVLAASTSARQQASVQLELSSLTVDAAMDWPEYCSKGYVPFRISIENASDSNKVFDVELLSRKAGTSTRTVNAPVGRTEFTMLFPAFNRDESTSSRFSGRLNDRSVRLRIAQGLDEDVDYGAGSVQFHSPEPIQTFVLLTDDPAGHAIPTTWLLEIAEDLGAAVARSAPAVIPNVQGKRVAFQNAPGRFEAYTSLDCVVVDLTVGLPESEVLDPLLRWVRLGGTALMVGPQASKTVRGNGELAGWFDERFTRSVESFDGALVAQYGLGRVVTLDQAKLALGNAESRRLLKWALDSSTTPAPKRELLETSLRPHPLPGAPTVLPEPQVDVSAAPPPDDVGEGPWIYGLERVPFRTLAIGLTLFTLLLGPINFMVVRRLRRPMLLLVSIPAISLFAGIVIIGFGLLSAGVSDRTAEFSYTVLDQRTHRASSVNLCSLWCAFAPDPFQPEAGTAILPGQSSVIEYETVGYIVDETNGLSLSGDFLPVRRGDRQVLLSDQTFRGRVEFQREGNSWQVTNGLGVDVSAFVYCDPAGQVFVLDGDLSDGARGVLQAQEPRLHRVEKDTLGGVLRWIGYADSISVVRGRGLDAELGAAYLEKIQGTELVPGTYVAVADGDAPWAADTGLDPERTFSRHVLMGVLDGEAGQ